VRDLRGIAPGMVFMMKSSSGGYSSDLGWTGKKTDIPTLIEPSGTEVEGDDDDLGVVMPWQTLIQHNDQVVAELKRVLSAFDIPGHL